MKKSLLLIVCCMLTALTGNVTNAQSNSSATVHLTGYHCHLTWGSSSYYIEATITSPVGVAVTVTGKMYIGGGLDGQSFSVTIPANSTTSGKVLVLQTEVDPDMFMMRVSSFNPKSWNGIPISCDTIHEDWYEDCN